MSEEIKPVGHIFKYGNKTIEICFASDATEYDQWSDQAEMWGGVVEQVDLYPQSAITQLQEQIATLTAKLGEAEKDLEEACSALTQIGWAWEFNADNPSGLKVIKDMVNRLMKLPPNSPLGAAGKAR